MKKRILSLICAVSVLAGSATWVAQSWGIETSGDLSISGYQISTTLGGIRTVYSVAERINNKRVNERGLVFGLATHVNANKVDLDHLGDYIKAFPATSTGLISSDNGSDTYVMTMDYGALTSQAFTQEYIVRPYAKLRDGSYVYGDADTFSTYDVASTLYSKSQMNNQSQHDYL